MLIIDLMMDLTIILLKVCLPAFGSGLLSERLGSGTYATVYKAVKKVGSVIICTKGCTK